MLVNTVAADKRFCSMRGYKLKVIIVTRIADPWVRKAEKEVSNE